MNTSVLIFSCDAYSDVWGPFFTLFFRYWNCPYDVFLCSETEQCLLPEVKTINASGTWTQRIHEAVAQIQTDYIICMCEDFFMRRNVRQDVIDDCIRSMDMIPGIACFNFEKDYDLPEVKGFSRKPNGSMWRKSCQATLWRRSVLLDLLNVSQNAWEWEESNAPDSYNYYVWTGPKDQLVFEYGYHNHEWFGIQKGKWVEHDVRPLFEKENINIDLSRRGTI